MSFIFAPAPAIQSRFADHYGSHVVELATSSIAETEREYADACARAEALRFQLIQKQRARELQAAAERNRLLEGYRTSNGFGAFPTNHPSYLSHGGYPQRSQGFGLGLYDVRPYSHPFQDTLGPRSPYGCSHGFSTQERERQEASVRFLTALKCQKAQERAQALALAHRGEIEARRVEAQRRAVAKEEQQVELRALIGPLVDILLGDKELLVDEQKVHGPTTCCARDPPLASQALREGATRDPARFQPKQRVHSASSLSFLAPPSTAPTPKPIDRKGKGRETPAIPLPRFSTTRPSSTPAVTPKPATTAPLQSGSFKDELLQRRATEADPEVKRTIDSLLLELYGLNVTGPTCRSASRSGTPSFDTRTKHSTKEVRFATAPQGPAPSSTQVPSTSQGPEDKKSKGAGLHRTPAVSPILAKKLLEVFHSRRARQLSLGSIEKIEEQLHKLETSFEFPSHLDFPETTRDAVPPSPTSSDSEFKLAFTPNNRAIHAYEHALNELLTKLDAVESQGDDEIRGRRKEVVGEVEKALNEVLRKIEDSRGRASLSDKQGGAKTDEHKDDSIIVQLWETVATEQSPTDPASVVSEENTVDTVAVFDTAITTEEQNTLPEEITVANVPETLIEVVSVTTAGNEVETEAPTTEIVVSAGTSIPSNEAEVLSGSTTTTPPRPAEDVAVDFAIDVPQAMGNACADTLDEGHRVGFYEETIESTPTTAISVASSDRAAIIENEEPVAVEQGDVNEDVVPPSPAVAAALESSPATHTDTDINRATPQDTIDVVSSSVAPLTTVEPSTVSSSDVSVSTSASSVPELRSPIPSESGSEDNSSFLLQQPSLLSDPEPKKHQENSNEDEEDIDVLSAGDLSEGVVDEKDEWSEVEA